MANPIDRRQLLAGSAALAAVGIVPIRVVARQASPVAGVDSTPTGDGIDVPLLEIAFTADGVTATTEVQAGTVRVLASTDGTDMEGWFVFRMPEGEDVDALLALARTLGAEPPEWFFDTTFVGGVRTASRVPGVVEGFIVLEPGTYVVMDVLTASAAPFSVTGEAAAPVEIPATVHVTAEDTMTYSGLEEPVPTGRQLWRFDNGGALHHNIYIYGRPEEATAEDILAIFEGVFAGATPEGGGDPFAEYGEGVMDTGMLSGGLTNWFYLDLEPGPYAAMCTSFDTNASPPHFIMGMIATFTVE